MSSKVAVLALLVLGTVYAQDSCGRPAVQPDVNLFRNVIAERTDSRIIGGTEATPNSWPWQISFQTRGDNFHFCGGVIVNKDWIVTAAHCCLALGRPVLSNFQIRVGAHDITRGSENGATTHTLSQIIVHPNYDDNNIENDYCLLKVSTPIVFSSAVSPVCLGTEAHEASGTTCWATGWGDTIGDGGAGLRNLANPFSVKSTNLRSTREAATRLRQVDLKLLSYDECQKIWGPFGGIVESNICAMNPRKHICQGDSGGPIVCASNGQYHLVGVSSFVYRGCTKPGVPGVFARTSFVNGWIAENTRS